MESGRWGSLPLWSISARQKTCFFRVLANKTRAAAGQTNGRPTPLGGISYRDAFPKDKVNDPKAKVKRSLPVSRYCLTKF